MTTIHVQYAIGTQFIRATGKSRPVETIVDIYTTRNDAGEVVKLRYVATHDYLGQAVTDHDVPEATIVRAQIP